MVREVTNGHFGGLFQMIINITLLTFCRLIREDLQQMELDTVFKRLNRFLTGLVLVHIALEVGPRRDTNLLENNLVPFEKGLFC